MTEVDLSDEAEISDEVDDLMQYFASRGFSPCDACTVMGMAITCLIRNKATAESFMQMMRNVFATTLETRQ